MAKRARKVESSSAPTPTERVDQMFRAPRSPQLRRAANDNPFSWRRLVARALTWVVPVMAFAVLVYAVLAAD